MLYPLPARALAGLAALATLSAGAQTAGAPVAETLAPQSVAVGRYQSAFEGYQAYSDDKVLSWKESNDTVGKIGGWRVYAREAQGAQPAPAKAPAGASVPTGAAPAAAAPAAVDPHAGHPKR